MTTTMRLTTDAGYPNRCTLRYADAYTDVVETRDFFAPADGGYVKENWSSPRQVCGNLSGGGATLTWNPKRDAALADLIRREYRAMRAAERREASRY